MQVKQEKHIPQNRGIRIICCGKELFASDPVSRAVSKVLHCTVTDIMPDRRGNAPVANVDPPVRPQVQPPPVDWVGAQCMLMPAFDDPMLPCPMQDRS